MLCEFEPKKTEGQKSRDTVSLTLPYSVKELCLGIYFIAEKTS
jgi:hypothetical protein